jgi:polar amino acid transport system substrate-binding protein
MLRKGRAALCLLGLAIVAMPSFAAENAFDRIVKAGVVKIGVPDNFPPFGTIGTDAKLEGYDIDTAALVAAGLGVKADLVPVASRDRIPFLTDGKVDLVVSSLGKNDEREKLIDFSAAYAPFFSGVYGPEPLEVAKPADLAGKTVAVTRGTIEDEALTKLAPPSAAIKRYDDNARTEVAFLSNQTQLIATGNVVAAGIFAQNPPKKPVIKFLLQNSPCHIGVKKGEVELLARVNAILAAARQDGGLSRMSQRWFGAPLDDPEKPAAVSAR